MTSITHWMCGGCKTPVQWYSTGTRCCDRITIGAYSNVPCIFCENSDLVHWITCSDGYTRRCACSILVDEDAESRPPEPNPHKAEGVAAMLLANVLNSLWPGLFVTQETNGAP